jgi:hypothetical protein
LESPPYLTGGRKKLYKNYNEKIIHTTILGNRRCSKMVRLSSLSNSSRTMTGKGLVSNWFFLLPLTRDPAGPINFIWNNCWTIERAQALEARTFVQALSRAYISRIDKH